MSNAEQTAVKSAPATDDDLITPDDLHKISEEREMAMLREVLERDRKRQQEQDAVRDAFLHQHLHPDAKERFTQDVKAAAARGQNEIQIIRFSSSFCTDGGRAINNFDSNWPDTLTGYAREVYDAYETRLKDKGYKIRAQILDYPGGMPGDVGIFLRW